MKFVELFAGIGGFSIGLEAAGHECVGQREIDPHALDVLARHWPHVPKHDDVSTLKHDTFPHPDLVTFGSPCQDLSVAGKRAGLGGGDTRSGLFYEAVRYIRDIQEATNGRLPECALWENVPGAYSSNNGRDFATVLALLVGGEVRVPTTGWPNAGVAFGPLGSAEWRTLDSQYFGVAQRRRRVFLVYRPGGERAGEVLLESDGVQRDPPQSRTPGQGITGSLTGGPSSSSAGNVDDNRAQAGFVIPVWKRRGGFGWSQRNDGIAPTLESQGAPENLPMVPVEVAPSVLASWGYHGYSSPRSDGTDPIVPVAAALTAREGKGPDSDATTTLVPVAFKVRGGVEIDSAGKTAGKGYLGSYDVALTLGAMQDQYLAQPTAYAARDYKTGRYEEADVAEPLTTSADRTRAAPIAFALRGGDDGAMPEISGDQANALRGSEGGSSRDYVASAYAVRRLTPRECERLQGFPDDHTRYRPNGTEIADTHRYRMCGNAVTTNVIEWIGRRLHA